MGINRTRSCIKSKKEIQLKKLNEDFNINNSDLYYGLLAYISNIAAGRNHKQAIESVIDITSMDLIYYFASVGLDDLSLRLKKLLESKQ